MGKKIGLIIQGPLTSHGKVGSSLHKNNNNLDFADFKDFDCSDLIQNLANSAIELFDQSVLVTWEDEKTYSFNVQQNKLHTIFLDENLYESTKLKGSFNSLRRLNNKKKQYATTYVGAKYLLNLGCDFVVKIRSDLNVNLDELMKIINEKIEGSQILVPFPKQINDEWALGDFVLGAPMGIFLDWFDVMNRYEFMEGVHQDLMIGLVYAFDLGLVKSPDARYFLREIVPNHVGKKNRSYLDKRINFLWNQVFVYPEKTFWINAELRGSKFSEIYVDTFYLQDKKYLACENDDHSVLHRSSLGFVKQDINVKKLLSAYLGDAWLRIAIYSLFMEVLDQVRINFITLKFRLSFYKNRLLNKFRKLFKI